MNYGPIRLPDVLGGTAPCARCGVLCRLANQKPSEEARIAKYADAETLERGTAMCITCVVSSWLRNSPLADMITPEKLRWQPFQTQMGALFKASGREDASAAEIDWDAMIANWDLPFPKAKRRRSKK